MLKGSSSDNDSSRANASMDDIQKDLSPLVKQLEPGKNESGAQIPFMAASDGIKQRKVVHQVASALTGPIIIDDVIYESADDDVNHLFLSKELIFRRLTFQRSKNLVQSEALLTREECKKAVGEKQHNNTRSFSKSKKRGNHRGNASNISVINEPSNDLKIDHDYLASSYHTGIVSGFMLISSYLQCMASTGGMVVELDPVILDLARDYFDFRENAHLKVHVMDGIQFGRDVATFEAVDGLICSNGITKPVSNGSCNTSEAARNKVGILIVDVDSSDLSSGMTYPAPDFVEKLFLLTAKSSLSEEGIFVVNLVSRSQSTKDLVVSRMKEVFSSVFSLQLKEDVNEVIFALNTENSVKEDNFPEASRQLSELLKLKHPERSQTIIDIAKKIKRI